MDTAVKMRAVITENVRLTDDIFSMWIEAGEIARRAGSGQFVNLYCRDSSRLLPRPISICEINREKGRIRLVYRVAGKGTGEFSQLVDGDFIEVMGPLGNGFRLSSAGNSFIEGDSFHEDSGRKVFPGKALIIGGGVGIPPLLELARELKCDKDIVLGYRDKTYLDGEFLSFGNVYISTEDGSRGIRGNVMDAVREHKLYPDIIYACGPAPMLRAVKAYAAGLGIRAQLSLEERMACGVGACLGCVCASTEVDPHSNMKNKRVCKEGPVFYAEEVEL